MNDRRALFLDRDGVLNVDFGYVTSDRVVLHDDVEAIAEASAMGYVPVVVSNQSGVARGYFGEDEVVRTNRVIVERLAARGVDIPPANFYVCMHGPDDGCGCRKPAPGLLVRAAHDLGLVLTASVLVGDAARDVEAGRRAGVRSWLLDRGPNPAPDALTSLFELIPRLRAIDPAPGTTGS